MEKLIELLSYVIAFIFVHELNANSYIKKNNPENKEYNKNVHRNITDIINVVVAFSVSIIYLITGYELKDNRLYGTNEWGTKAVLIHVALCIYEIFYNVISEKNISMLIHHLVLICTFSYSIYRKFILFYISSAGFAEITNIFLIPVTIMKRNKVYLDKLVYPGIGLFLSFLFARIFLFPYVYNLSTYDIPNVKNKDIYHFHIARTMLMLIFVLSCYWFIKITRGLIKEGSKMFTPLNI